MSVLAHVSRKREILTEAEVGEENRSLDTEDVDVVQNLNRKRGLSKLVHLELQPHTGATPPAHLEEANHLIRRQRRHGKSNSLRSKDEQHDHVANRQDLSRISKPTF